MSFANYTARALLNSLFGKTSNFGALASAPTIYVGLSTTAPSETGGTVTEPANGYTRVETAAADWNGATDADPSVVTNAEEIVFPEATGSWGTVTHFFLASAASGTGDVILASGSLGTPKAPTTADTPRFQATELSVSLD